MAWIIVSANPFEPLTVDKYEVLGGTVSNWVANRHPETKEFPVPTICLLNGKPLLRKDWNYEIRDRDVINFIAVQGWEVAIAVVISVVLSVLVTLLTPVPKTNEDNPSSDPVFSIKGQSNSIRLGEPIECCYGRNRIYPSYASAPYFEYADNDQYQFALFCLGHGFFEINQVLIGDTEINSFQDVTYEVIPPGGNLTIFPSQVYTSIEVGGQELERPSDYVPVEGASGGYAGPFAANQVGTVATQLQVDIVLPRGIYVQSATGSILGGVIWLQIEYRLIDDSGVPLGAWTTFDPLWANISIYTNVLVLTGATLTPQRRTYRVNVAEGRYEVRMRRIIGNTLNPEFSGDTVMWEAMRAWLVGEFHDYGNVTLLAVKIRANNNLNDQTQQKFNVVATRKLPIRESSGVWSEPVATRSLVWAFVDVFRSVYGARITEDPFFDWDGLEALDALYTSRNEYFDWIFRDPITVWEAARIIARVGRGVPLLTGSMISVKRDGPLSLPVTLFNHENIVEGSFEWLVKLWDLDEFDSIRVEYTDPATGYKQETVTAVLPGGTGDTPEDLRLVGVQNRTHAYREGLYTLAARLYLRENISFDTGMEGYIPTYGDLIAVTHDVPKWGQAGYVTNAVRGEGITYHLWLSEPLDWSDSNPHQIMLRNKQGGVYGPFTAYQTADPMQVMIDAPDTIDFLLTGKTDPMLFLFGVSGEVTKMMKVVKITPSGGETIRIDAVNDNALIHSFDELTPPALGTPATPPVAPDLPTISQLFIAIIAGPLLTVQISWSAAFGAQSYVVQTSEDGVNWTDRGRVAKTSIQLQVRAGDLYVRVAAINSGQGPWIDDSVSVGPLSSLFLGIPWDADEWQVTWLQVLNSVGWRVKVYDISGSDFILKRTEDLELADPRVFLYDLTKATADSNIVREMRVEVDVLFENEGVEEPSGSPAVLELFNAIPAAPTNPQYAFDSGDVSLTEVIYQLTWVNPEADDLIRVKVWVSETEDFDPSVVLPVYDYTAASPGFAGVPEAYNHTAALDSFGEHPTLYWRVAVFDCWGNEIADNITTQQMIPAFI